MKSRRLLHSVAEQIMQAVELDHPPSAFNRNPGLNILFTL